MRISCKALKKLFKEELMDGNAAAAEHRKLIGFTLSLKSIHFTYSWKTECINFEALTEGFPSVQGFTMALKRRRATSPSSSVSGGDFDDNQTPASVSSVGRKRRRTSNIPTVDPVNLFYKFNLLFRNL